MASELALAGHLRPWIQAVEFLKGFLARPRKTKENRKPLEIEAAGPSKLHEKAAQNQNAGQNKAKTRTRQGPGKARARPLELRGKGHRRWPHEKRRSFGRALAAKAIAAYLKGPKNIG
jgi:hypothetical protein